MFNRHSTSIAELRRLASASITWFLLLVPSVSLANDPFCSLSSDQSILIIVRQFDRLAELLPSVPKEQNQAMAEQERLGLTLGLDARDPAGSGKAFDTLTNNPYYYLRGLRGALKRARDAVSIILLDAKSLRADKYIGLGFPIRFYQEEYADTDAVKLDHAGFAVGPVAALEIAIGEYLLRDQQLSHPNLAPATRGEIESLASGYTANLGRYMQCKMSDVTARHNVAAVASTAP
jgi:hypothetical protein